MADKTFPQSLLLTLLLCVVIASALESYQCPYGEFKCTDGRCVWDETFCNDQCPFGEFQCKDGMCVVDETFCNTKGLDVSSPSYIYIIVGIFGFLIFVAILMACFRSCSTNDDPAPPGFKRDVAFQTGRIRPPESTPILHNHLGTSSNYQATGTQYVYTSHGYQPVAPRRMTLGTNRAEQIIQPATPGYGLNATAKPNQHAISGYGSALGNTTTKPMQPAISGYGSALGNTTTKPMQPAISGYRPDGTYSAM